ncbi:jg1916 [Pararge aegeria aegeria]|uniref:Jg1916 protein n=1 Tax=Pararge aegeria aegeria TaxID=348720 RepID=A0A8S4R5X6_9NEOP|nr:jg1916 [Pararge aegeria aegeria]
MHLALEATEDTWIKKEPIVYVQLTRLNSVSSTQFIFIYTSDERLKSSGIASSRSIPGIQKVRMEFVSTA